VIDKKKRELYHRELTFISSKLTSNFILEIDINAKKIVQTKRKFKANAYSMIK